MLEISNLKKSFAGRDVLNGVTFDLRIGGRVAIIGGVGSGKTTLLDSILGYKSLTNGTVLFENKKLPYENKDRVVQLRKSVGYISQNDYFLKGTTIFNHFKWIFKMSESQIVDLTAEVGLSTVLYSPVEILSESDKWRLKLALASVGTNLIVIDDPLSSLSFEESIGALQKLFQFLEQRNIGVLITTSSEDLIKEFYMDRVYKLVDGVLV
jgi:ABC-type phosphate/phosphonate transport system ATPase subunit